MFPPKSARITLALVILLFVFVLGIGAVVLTGPYQDRPINQESPSDLTEPKRQHIWAQPTLPSSDTGWATSNWQIYSNKEYGFQLRYPDDWIISEVQSTIPFVLLDSPDYSGETISSPVIQAVTSGTRVIIAIYEDLGGFALDEFIGPYHIQRNRRPIDVGNVQGITFDTVIEFGIHQTVIVLILKNSVYQITRIYPELDKNRYQDTFNRILSTFQFSY